MTAAGGFARRAALIYNPDAGATGQVDAGVLLTFLARAGFRAEHRATSAEADLDDALADPGDLVVAAGGDGTVRAVALRVLARGVPMAIVPLGTANNIALSLGLAGRTPEQIIAGLTAPRAVRVDVGEVAGPRGVVRFLESAGVGLFADLLRAYDPAGGRSLLRAAAALLQVLPRYQAPTVRATIDGDTLGGACLLVEVMNTAHLGMRLPVAPDADPADGWLDVAFVEDSERVGLAAYLGSVVAGDLSGLPNWRIRRGRHIRLAWEGSACHCDEILVAVPDGQEARGDAEVSIRPGALEVWLPEGVRP